MIKAVLFDLDDTLLDLNLAAFSARYAAGLTSILSRAARIRPTYVGHQLARGYLALNRQDRADDLSNAEVFRDHVRRTLGVPLLDPALVDLVSYYEREVVPTLNGTIVKARPKHGGRAAVNAVHSLGLTCALATNPTFSLQVVHDRMAWADVYPEDFALISTWENSTRTKPSARYYREFAARLGLTPAECLMVGNDSLRDFPRPDCGMRTCYVGHARARRAVWRGSMRDLAAQLPDIIGRVDSLSE